MANMRYVVRFLGAAFLAAGIVMFFMKLDVELKFGNLGSRPDWVPPAPTAYDRIILQSPVTTLVVIGGLLFVASYLKSRKAK
jgi:hypothetical protein